MQFAWSRGLFNILQEQEFSHTWNLYWKLMYDFNFKLFSAKANGTFLELLEKLQYLAILVLFAQVRKKINFSENLSAVTVTYLMSSNFNLKNDIQ